MYVSPSGVRVPVIGRTSNAASLDSGSTVKPTSIDVLVVSLSLRVFLS